jgi:hypothetical protein
MTYKLYKTVIGENAVTKTNEDGSISSFILGLGNPEEETYLKWVAEGNLPSPADIVEPSQASVTPLPADE